MTKILQKEFGMNRRSKLAILAAVLVFSLFSVALVYQSSRVVRKNILGELENSMANISELNADAVYRELNNRKRLLDSMAASLSGDQDPELALILKKMRIYKESYDFYNMGILTPDGILHTISGEELDTTGIAVYERALAGEAMITESVDELSGDSYELNLLTSPIFRDGELRYVLVGAYRSYELIQLLNFNAFNGNSLSFFLDSEGKVVIFPERGMEEEYLKLLRHIDKTPELLPKGGGLPYFVFSYEGNDYYAHFEPLQINDWYLMICAKEEDVLRGTQVVLRNILVNLIYMWLLVGFLIGLILFHYLRNQKRLQNVVFRDKLLKEKNFEYLRVYYSQISKEERDRMAFFVLDVDRFKEFNYIHGSSSGDRLLKYINRVFHEELPEDQIFRNAADMFAGMLHCGTDQEAEQKIRKLLARIAADIERKAVYTFELSIGICRMGPYEDLQIVYSDALIAKNTVKRSYLRKYAFYDDRMRRDRLNYMEMETSFQEALRRKEFKVYYQPKYDMRTGEITGSEALVRWQKTDGSIISPGEFIPCFEASGQIVMLDEYVLQEVCAQMALMEEEGIAIRPVSVNFSRMHLNHPGIGDSIAQMLRSGDIRPENVAFEITESALLEENIPLEEIVSQLHALGCRVNMDDYGVGVSNTGSLARIPFDVLKLDKSFIDMIGDRRMESVIRSTIRLAAELGMGLIAEGVENEKQVKQLMEWGCFYAQGYYYSRPVPEETYKAMLQKKA